MAGRTVQPVVMPDSVPRSKSHADCWFGIVDPAGDLPILPPLKERARVPLFPIGINPVIDPVYRGQVIRHKAFGSAISPVRKADKDMGEDIPTATCNPWYKVIDDPFLVPSPFLTALPALAAVLGHGMDLSGEEGVGHPVLVFSLMAEEQQKKIIPVWKIPGPGIRQPGLCGNPEGGTGLLPLSPGKEDSGGLIKKNSSAVYEVLRSALMLTVPIGALTDPL